MKQRFNLFQTQGILSRVSRACRESVGRLSTLLFLIFLGLGFSSQAWADDADIASVGAVFSVNSNTEKYAIHKDNWLTCTNCTDWTIKDWTSFDSHDFGTVGSFKLKGVAVSGWKKNNNWFAAKIFYKIYKSNASEPSSNTGDFGVGDYGGSGADPNQYICGTCYNSDGSDKSVIGMDNQNVDLIDSRDPGNYKMKIYTNTQKRWNGGNYGSKTDYAAVTATFTIPGFTTTSTSKDYGNVAINTENSATISFTQHYGTALTTSNCSITGTNKALFTVTGISETGVTVKFKPTTAGSKSATLTITDANNKTCTITLTGTVPQTALTLDKNNSDLSGSSNGSGTISLGSGSFTATQPTRTGYDAEGYYLESGCSTKVSNASGTLQASVSDYTDANKKWIYTGATKTLYTKWSPITTTVTFDQTGCTASTYTSQDFTYDANLSTINSQHRPTAPNGYTYEGYSTKDGTNGDWGELLTNGSGQWNVVSGYTAQVGDNKVWKYPSTTLTVYSKLTPTTYTITYKDKGNVAFSGTSWSAEGTHPASYTIETATITLASPGKTGYTFGGWFSDAACTAGNEVTQIASGSYGNKTLYAKWTPKTTTLILHQKAGDAAEIRRVIATFDAAFDESQLTPTLPGDTMRTGYSFVRFLTTQEAGGGSRRIIIQPDPDDDNRPLVFGKGQGSFTTSGRKWKSELTELDIYGDWTARTYTITLNDKGGSGGSGEKTATFDKSTDITTVTKPTRTDYTFAGYYDDEDGNGVQVYDANGNLIASAGSYTDSNRRWKYADNVTLYAKWNASGNYVVTLDPLTGATTQGTTKVDVQINTTKGLTSSITCPTKTGYTFGGYFTTTGGGGTQAVNADGSWTIPSAGFINENGEWIYAGNQTFKAYWIANDTKVKLDQQGGTGGTTQKTLTYNSTQNLGDITLPTREGYTFGGYFTQAAGAGTQLITYQGKWMTVSNYTQVIGGNLTWVKTDTTTLTLYAKWTENIFDLDITHEYHQLDSAIISAYTVVDATISNATGIAKTYDIDASGKTKDGFYHTQWNIPSGKVKYNSTTYSSTKPITNDNLTQLTINGWQTAGTDAIQMRDYWIEYSRKVNVAVVNGTIQDAVSQLDGIGVYTGKSVTAIANTGYHFTGWTKSENTNYTINLSAQDALTTEVRVSSNQTGTASAGTITANFAETKHTATIAYKCGDNEIADQTTSGQAGIASTVQVTAPAITGYTFSTWELTEGVTLAAGSSLSNASININITADSKTITAKYTEDMHTVTIVGGTEVSASAGIATTGSATAATAETGKHFVEWEIPSSEHFKLVDCEITDETIYFNATAGEMVVTAKYIDTDYKLKMIVNPAGKGTTVPTKDTIIHYDSPFDIKAIPNPGYEFVNWVSSEHGGKADIDFTASVSGASVSARKTGIVISNDAAGAKTGNARLVNPNDAILTANFQIINYTIKYNTNGGTEVADGSYTVESETFALPTTTRTGFAFAGWYNNAELEGDPVTQITKGSIGDTIFYAKWETTHVYLEGRARVKNAEGVETTINPDAEWVQTLKTIPFTFNSTDGVYYLNTYCTVLEQAANVGTGSNYIRMGIANGDGAVTPYGCNTAEDYKFTPDAKGSVVGATNGGTNNKSFKFRDVENYENDNFKRRYPVMYRYNPTTNMFDYCAPLLTLAYSGATATMSQMKIEFAKATATPTGLTSETITYEYKLGDGAWTAWTEDIVTVAGTYKLRATASGNNEFGQPVENVVSNEITVTVTTPAVSAQVTHVNSNPGSIIRVNDSFTIKHTVTGVPAEQSVKVCYHWSKKPTGSAIDHDIFTQVDGDPTSVWTSIDLAGDYEIEISVANDVCQDSLSNPDYIKWMTYKLPIHVKGDEITVYAKLEKSITDWEKKFVYYWRDAAGTWPGYEMSYIGKDSLDYEWYSYNIANYKTFEGGKLLFNDGTTKYGLYQTTNVNMPVDDEFYYIKAAVEGDKRKVETYDHIDVTRRVILTTDTTALYQYVTIQASGLGVFFPTNEEMEYTYTVTDPDGLAVTLDAKKQFIPSKAGNYTLTIKCDAGTYSATNNFTLRVQANPLTLEPSATGSIAIGTSTTVTVKSSGTLPSGNRTYTVIEPGTNAPITFQSNTASNTSSSYTLLSSGTYTFAVVLTDNSGNITGKAQCNVTVQPKVFNIKHPFKNTSSVQDADWVWKELTYNAIDGTYQYKGDDAYFHKDKVANISLNTPESSEGLKKYKIANPDNLEDNTQCVFVYDITLDSVTVYDLHKRLYRIKSVCAGNEYFSNAITENGQDMSFFAQKDGQLIWQERETAADPWVDQAVVVTTKASASGIYTAKPDVKATEFDLTAYTGNISVFTQLITNAGSGAGTATAANGKMTEFTKEYETDYYNHYWVRYVKQNAQAMATVGNSINPCLAITLPYYEMPADGNVRYAYDNTTNHFSRTFLAGSGDKDFLRIYGQYLDTLVSGSTYNPLNSLENSKKFNDGSDWIYTVEASGTVNATQSVTGILVTKFNNTNRWILSESGLEADPASERIVLNKDVASPGRYNLTAIYDYKTNRLTAGGQPEPGHVFEDTVLIDQLILAREGDNDASYFNVLENAKLVVVDKMTVELIIDKQNDFINKWGGTQDAYTVMYYWFSVPYQCRVSDIYGMGVYGEKFEVQRYRGDLRAQGTAGGGQAASAWRKLKATATMEANRGYVIAIRVMGSDFKEANKQYKLRLFFPSTEKVELSHSAKTILAENESSKTSNLHWNWNIMGNPLIANGKGIIDKTGEDDEADLNFIYLWDWAGGQKVYTPWSYDEVALKSTHGYMVQGKGAVYWSYPTIDQKTAPTRYLEAAQFASDDSYGKLNLRLNIKQDDQLLDKTYILYREDGDREEYEMGRDLEKIVNSGVTQMYAVTNNNLAAICLSSEDKDMIPLTVIANKDGDYTFSLHRQLNSNLEPTLYDDETGQYYNLGLNNAVINIDKGTHNDRFFFLLKKNGVITNVGELNSNNYQDGVQKVIMNEQLYIIRDGKIYNATGSVVE